MAQILKTEVKEKILQAALQEFSQKGYGKTTMASIASASGVPVGNIYNYFRNKENLLDHIVKPLLASLPPLFISPPEFPVDPENFDPSVVLDELLKKRVDFLSSHSREMIFFLQGLQGTKYEKKSDEFVNSFIEGVVMFVKKLKRGALPDQDTLFLIRIIYGNLISGLVEILKKGRDAGEIKMLLSRLLEYHNRGLWATL